MISRRSERGLFYWFIASFITPIVALAISIGLLVVSALFAKWLGGGVSDGFSHGIGRLIKSESPEAARVTLEQLLFYGVICATAFFTLLPTMHERYLLPAPCFLNIAVTLGIKSKTVWPAISVGVLLIFAFSVANLIMPEKLQVAARQHI